MAKIIPINKLREIRKREDECTKNRIIDEINVEIRRALRIREPEITYIFDIYPHLINVVEEELTLAGYDVQECIKRSPHDDTIQYHYLKISGWDGFDF